MSEAFSSSNPARWTWIAPRQVLFGWGRREELGKSLKSTVRRVWIIPGSRRLSSSPNWQKIQNDLTAEGIDIEYLPTISHEPLTTDVDQAIWEIRKRGIHPGDAILAIGGGSALDLGKAVAGLAPQSGFETVVDYLEGVGSGRRLTEPGLPFVAMPTTAGTGSEATHNAVISSLEPTYKKSLRSPDLVADLVVIDPELTVTSPREITIWCGMDALTQLLESLISCRATPLTQKLALEGLTDFPEMLLRVAECPLDQSARERLAYGAYLSGLTLANGGLGIAHGIAAALGIQSQTPHGLACAMLLPLALRLNFESSIDRLSSVGRLWDRFSDESDREAATSVLKTVDRLLAELQIPQNLGELGIKQTQISGLVIGSRGNSRNGNPIPLDDEVIHRELERML